MKIEIWQTKILGHWNIKIGDSVYRAWEKKKIDRVLRKLTKANEEQQKILTHFVDIL